MKTRLLCVNKFETSDGLLRVSYAYDEAKTSGINVVVDRFTFDNAKIGEWYDSYSADDLSNVPSNCKPN